MDTLGLISIVIAITAIFCWISLRWLKNTIIGVPLLSSAATFVTIAFLDASSSAREACAGVQGVFDKPLIYQYAVLPFVLFTAAASFKIRRLDRKELSASLVAALRAVAATLLVAFVIGSVSTSIDWRGCLLLGTLFSATDYVAVARMLHRTSVSIQMRRNLVRESLITSGIAAVLFLALTEARPLGTGHWTIGLLCLEAGGGIFLGIAAGWAIAHAIAGPDDDNTTVLMTGVLVIVAFLVTRYFGLAGPTEAIASGLALQHFSSKERTKRLREGARAEFWNGIGEIEYSILFVVLCFSVAASGLTFWTLLAGSLVFTLNILLRIVSVHFGLAPPKQTSARFRSAILFAFGGFRGTITMALALSVPHEMGRSWIIGVTFIVVVLSAVVQGFTASWLFRVGTGNAGQPHLIST